MVIPKDTRTPQEGLIIAGFGAVLLFILVGSVWWRFAHAPSTTPNTAPQFSADSQVRITVPGSVSISVLAKCPTGFSTDPVGVASESDEALILERKACNQEWWYQIAISKATSSTWNGQGWLPGSILSSVKRPSVSGQQGDMVK